MLHLPLEFIELGTVLVPTVGSTFAIAFPTLLLAPFGDFVGGHDGKVRWSIAILGLIEEWRLLLVGRLLEEVVGGVGGDLALFRIRREGLLFRKCGLRLQC